MPVDLHYVCRHQECWTRLDAAQFETGNWTCSDETADDAIGGRIYLHETRSAPAWHGGTITNWRPAQDLPDKVVFTYSVDGPFRVVLKKGWGQERAIIRRDM
jgi:hypothetical protein